MTTFKIQVCRNTVLISSVQSINVKDVLYSVIYNQLDLIMFNNKKSSMGQRMMKGDNTDEKIRGAIKSEIERGQI